VRKWPGYTLDLLTQEDILALPLGSVDVLITPFVLHSQENPGLFIQRMWHLLAEGGLWLLVDVSPLAMPGHWLYTHLPEAWAYAHEHFLSIQDVYLMAREAGFEVSVREHTWYQDAIPAAALALLRAGRRALHHMPEEIFVVGINTLRRLTEERGGDMLPTEVTVLVARCVRA